MLVFVHIDISGADLALFDEYERRVFGLLSKYGAYVEMRMRSVNGRSETHLLYFPDVISFAAFGADPTRIALQEIWGRSGATSTVTEVIRLD